VLWRMSDLMGIVEGGLQGYDEKEERTEEQKE
jgi:hypothetical protein